MGADFEKPKIKAYNNQILIKKKEAKTAKTAKSHFEKIPGKNRKFPGRKLCPADRVGFAGRP